MMGAAARAPTAGKGFGSARGGLEGRTGGSGRERAVPPALPSAGSRRPALPLGKQVGPKAGSRFKEGIRNRRGRCRGSDLGRADRGQGGFSRRMFSSSEFFNWEELNRIKGSKVISKGGGGGSFAGGMRCLLIQAPKGYRRSVAGSLAQT